MGRGLSTRERRRGRGAVAGPSSRGKGVAGWVGCEGASQRLRELSLPSWPGVCTGFRVWVSQRHPSRMALPPLSAGLVIGLATLNGGHNTCLSSDLSGGLNPNAPAAMGTETPASAPHCLGGGRHGHSSPGPPALPVSGPQPVLRAHFPPPPPRGRAALGLSPPLLGSTREAGASHRAGYTQGCVGLCLGHCPGHCRLPGLRC